jgi:predicted small secreted protein
MLMRSGLVVAAVLAAGTVLGGCDSVSSAADKVSVCTEALTLAGFLPDVSDPGKSIADAQDRAKRLTTLANDVADADVERALRGVAGELNAIKPVELTPKSAVNWAEQKVDRVSRVSGACT